MHVGDLVTWVSAGSCLVTVAIGCSLDRSQQSCDEPECCGHQVGTWGHCEVISPLRHLRHLMWVGNFRVRLAHSWNFLFLSPPHRVSGDLTSSDLEQPRHPGFIRGGQEDSQHIPVQAGGAVSHPTTVPPVVLIFSVFEVRLWSHVPCQHPVLLVCPHLGQSLPKDVLSKHCLSQERLSQAEHDFSGCPEGGQGLPSLRDFRVVSRRNLTPHLVFCYTGHTLGRAGCWKGRRLHSHSQSEAPCGAHKAPAGLVPPHCQPPLL